MKNLDVVKILNNIADILELQEIPFKPQAYRNAVRGIDSLGEDIEAVYKKGELENIPGIGKHIAKKIIEIIETGKLIYYEKLKKDVKVDIENLKRIPSLGPKKIKILYQKLGVKTIRDLELAIAKGKLGELVGFGEETIKNLSEGIKFLKSHPKRFKYIETKYIVEKIKEYLSKFSEVKKIEVAGSFRRGKETIGDLDFLIVSDHPKQVMSHFVNFSGIKKVLVSGNKKTSVLLEEGIQIDLRVVSEKEFGSALLYFTGNKLHNIELRKLALKQGYTLSEYGLFKLKNKQWIAGRTEEEVYQKLGLSFIPPEIRRNLGELKVAAINKIPKLVVKEDIKGIFHNHSTWSDGANSLLEMAQVAEKLKLKFISFNDHFGPLAIANPVKERQLDHYLKDINKVQKKVDITVFSGLEIDILKDGKLPLSIQKLKQLDVVIAAVHMSTKMSEIEMTKRVVLALKNNPINILAHPTDRLIDARPELNIDMEKIFFTAKETDTFLEINSSPNRMDLSGDYVKRGKEIGCNFAISTDAHQVETLKYYELGVLNARRGWLEKKDVLNSWTLPKIEKYLKK